MSIEDEIRSLIQEERDRLVRCVAGTSQRFPEMRLALEDLFRRILEADGCGRLDTDLPTEEGHPVVDEVGRHVRKVLEGFGVEVVETWKGSSRWMLKLPAGTRIIHDAPPGPHRALVVLELPVPVAPGDPPVRFLCRLPAPAGHGLRPKWAVVLPDPAG
jgi:hypothetical protein